MSIFSFSLLCAERDPDWRDSEVSCGTESLSQTEADLARACLALRAKVVSVAFEGSLHEHFATKRESVPEVTDTVAQEIGQRHPSATVGSAEETFLKLPALAPDVILMDVNLHSANGVQCVERLAPVLPKTYFIMLTVFDDTEVVFQSLSAGAIGYLTKPVASERLLEAIWDVCEGGAPMTSSIARRIVQAFRKPAADSRVTVAESLAPCEQEVLKLLSKGYLQKEIADQLAISFPTVRTLTARIYMKLHVHSRSQAVAKYLGEHG